MNPNKTIDTLRQMRLHRMAELYHQAVTENLYGKVSTIVCSQIPVAGWHKLIGEGTIADAILDRLVHSSHRLELTGESLRKKHGMHQ